jgi:hypothetical protein
MPSPKPRLYFKNVAGQWRARTAATAGAPLKIFSPYITGKQTLRLAQGNDQAEVYTLFEAELFASGASTLAEVKALVAAGIEVYQLPDLHAKVVWIPGCFLSVGSQNLTTRGTRNKEATATVSHEPWMSHVEAALQRWTLERQRITPEHIEDMEHAIAPLRAEFKRLKARLVAVDEAVRAAEERRERLRVEERERQRRQGRDRLAQLAAFSQSFRRLRASREITAVVREFDGGRVSLVASPGTSFLRWELDDKPVHLERLKRYLCVVPDLGRLGWARVSNGNISFVESSADRRGVKFLGERCGVNWVAPVDGDGHNLAFQVAGHSSLPSTPFELWVDADAVTLAYPGKVDKAVRTRWDEISAEIARHLSTPFKYTHKLSGKKADKFFYAEVGSEFQVRLARLHGHEILVAEAANRP